MTDPAPQGIHHVRLTVTDIGRSKEFYTDLLGSEPAIDQSHEIGDPEARRDPQHFYAGCIFQVGEQLLGLRPVAPTGDTFDSTRVGLDHVSLTVGSRADLEAAVVRLDAAGVEHGEINVMEDSGLAILSLQDPDDINLELTATL